MTNGNSGKVFFGWWVVLASAVGLAVHFGPVITLTFGLFVKPLGEDFGWGRGQISLGFTLATLVIVVLQPVAGRLVDRVGARLVILPGAALLGCCIMAFSLFNGTLWFYYLLFMLAGLFATTTNPVPYSKIVSRWFDRRRGLALALAVSGSSLGSIIWPNVVQHVISGYGWRTAYMVMGAAMIALAIPVVALWLRDDPRDLGLTRDGAASSRTARDNAIEAEGISFREARGTAAFWLMVIAFGFVSLSFHGCLLHLVPMLTDRGITPELAAGATSILAFGIVVGRVVTGLLLDRFFAPYVALVFFLCATLGIFLLASGIPGTAIFVAAALIGLAEGAELDIMPFMLSRYFGLKEFGTIYSFTFSAFILGGVIGPYAMGVAFDRTGGYAVAMPAMIVLPLIAAACMWQLPPYRFGRDGTR